MNWVHLGWPHVQVTYVHDLGLLHRIEDAAKVPANSNTNISIFSFDGKKVEIVNQGIHCLNLHSQTSNE